MQQYYNTIVRIFIDFVLTRKRTNSKTEGRVSETVPKLRYSQGCVDVSDWEMDGDDAGAWSVCKQLGVIFVLYLYSYIAVCGTAWECWACHPDCTGLSLWRGGGGGRGREMIVRGRRAGIGKEQAELGRRLHQDIVGV